jgi:hypothetical protein
LSLLYPIRLGKVRKAIKSAIIGPPSFLCQFFKILQIDSIQGGTPEVLRDERTD